MQFLKLDFEILLCLLLALTQSGSHLVLCCLLLLLLLLFKLLDLLNDPFTRCLEELVIALCLRHMREGANVLATLVKRERVDGIEWVEDEEEREECAIGLFHSNRRNTSDKLVWG